MTKLLFSLLLAFVVQTSFAQTLSYEDFKTLVPSLKKEAWATVYQDSQVLLDNAPQDTSDFHAIILYIHLYAGAGMVSESQLSYEELQANALNYQGQRVIMAAHPVVDADGGLNQTSIDEENGKYTAFTSAANGKGTSIFCFEKFTFSKKIKIKKFPVGSFVRCGGTLEKIEFNPNQSKIWIMRLTVSDAFIRKLE